MFFFPTWEHLESHNEFADKLGDKLQKVSDFSLCVFKNSVGAVQYFLFWKLAMYRENQMSHLGINAI